jgi:CBS domain-containing protein
MLIPLKEFIEGHRAPRTVTLNTSVREALAIMRNYDYSQLPIVDDQGYIKGMISEQSIVNTYFDLNGSLNLLELKVDHCQQEALTISLKRDLFDAIKLLESAFAVIVEDNNKPVGIVTNFDTASYFRDLSEDLIVVEKIESELREYIRYAFPESSVEKALHNAFKNNPRFQDSLGKSVDDLSLAEYVQVIQAEENWAKFEGAFEPRSMFRSYMENVRKIRNQLAHFRGKLDQNQKKTLLAAKTWIDNRPSLKAMNFTIETSRSKNLGGDVTEKRKQYFVRLLDGFKEVRPGIAKSKNVSDQNWIAFGAGRSGFGFAWVFTARKELQVELYIDTGTRETNKKAFDELLIQKREIEKTLGFNLRWERLNEKRASRISVGRPLEITDTREKLDQGREWAVDTMAKFVDTFRPLIFKLPQNPPKPPADLPANPV